ncbi:MAG: anthranilate phosphoribosyltransferase [Rhodothermales bacterium]|nr:anthranilate phosphoribosyltransferase [Rhodothermales bacterium]MBO6779665.1 anthranilate phosphoribosyltransferase [Rhodothermales bacterium]
MTDYLKRIAAGERLTFDEACAVMHLLLKGEASPEQTAGLLMGLRGRGESLDELTGFTKVMREYAVPVAVNDPDAIDVVGTGGDGSGTFNISTATMFVCAGAGATVAKHGNRSVSSKCGSADVLRELGVFVELPAEQASACINQAGLGFMFAPLFHPALRFVMPVRRALAARTFFNILGPLCNPAGVQSGLFGAFAPDVADAMGQILERLGGRRVLTVHSEDGLDEFSIAATTTVRSFGLPAWALVRPEDLGLPSASLADIRGGDASVNADIIRAILRGDEGPHRDVVLLNAAFALITAGKCDDPQEGLELARESIDGGGAARSLQAMVDASQSLRPSA